MRSVGGALCQLHMQLLCWQRQSVGEVVRQGDLFGPVHSEIADGNDKRMERIGKEDRGEEWLATRFTLGEPSTGPVSDLMRRPLFGLEANTSSGDVIFRLGNSVLVPTHRFDAAELRAQPGFAIAADGVAVVGGQIDRLEPIVRHLDMVVGV
ncbi:hypothetical protein [Sagittula sp.]|uniref:hypothetical protein n=1 Tax=Sagittula sp. TaxID=2038081 RepID=UPI004059A913